MGTLYLVGTPIGNLEDITLRALRVLREVQLIAAEDTRETRKLLGRYGITTPVVSYHTHSRPARLRQLLAALQEGDVAVVSEAGMPGISDPGAELVQAASAAGHSVVVVPGPSAVTAAAAVSGMVTDGFLFLGFLPRRSSERREQLAAVRSVPYPLIVFEAPHRLREMLADALEVLGDRSVAVCRELTKQFEEVQRTTLRGALSLFEQREPRGEFVLVIAAEQPTPTTWDETAIRGLIAERLAAGLAPSAVARELARVTGLPRRELYRIAVATRWEHAVLATAEEGEEHER
ncbi:16S rRNA (cytidine(1402)-2'-O)-methyltransferase [Thermomicrobium sp. CFH 73360]|uniref:16S rRNA (cytidine(1402)-2'-O)-methyltransferase n=1 Tax=Thermomicrobium sp. CFH 73360 TaxID=2951987 RepID=UPI0020775F47|nr:16S rRNA (cytidine(1402)-2'-O)-methyltransferase [Thermomicrobium sp. CFH 73360]MCM8746173.1 16S rRNA (cytidine(1402)-2'-O)-methyltransferase [Thermomicrobium sp. CFH 73360]